MTLVLSPAGADLDLAPTTTFPNTVTVGDQSQTFLINVTNTSNPIGNPTDPTIPVTLTEVGITPSCANLTSIHRLT